MKELLWSKPNERASSLLDGGSPFNRCYRTKDNKFMAVGAFEPKIFSIVCQVFNLFSKLNNNSVKLLKGVMNAITFIEFLYCIH